MNIVYMHSFFGMQGNTIARAAFDRVAGVLADNPNAFPFAGLHYEIGLCASRDGQSAQLAVLVARETQFDDTDETVYAVRGFFASVGVPECESMNSFPAGGYSLAAELGQFCDTIALISGGRLVMSGGQPYGAQLTPEQQSYQYSESAWVDAQGGVAAETATAKKKTWLPILLISIGVALAAGLGIFFGLFYGPSPDADSIVADLKSSLPALAEKYARANGVEDVDMFVRAVRNVDYDALGREVAGQITFARGDKTISFTVQVPCTIGTRAVSMLPRYSASSASEARDYLSVLDESIRDAITTPVEVSDGETPMTVPIEVEVTITFAGEGKVETTAYNSDTMDAGLEQLAQSQEAAVAELVKQVDVGEAVELAVTELTDADRAYIVDRVKEQLPSGIYLDGDYLQLTDSIEQWVSFIDILWNGITDLTATSSEHKTTVSFTYPDYSDYFNEMSARLIEEQERAAYFRNDFTGVANFVFEYIYLSEMYTDKTMDCWVEADLDNIVNARNNAISDIVVQMSQQFEQVAGSLYDYVVQNCLVDYIDRPPTSILTGEADSGAIVDFYIDDGQDHCVIWTTTDGSFEIITYIRAYETLSFYIPDGDYNVRYCWGDTWYGMGKWYGAEGKYAVHDYVLNYISEQYYNQYIETVDYGSGDGNVDYEDFY